MAHIVVVGGGITGLVAAYALVHAHTDPAPRVTLMEASNRLGGKIRSGVFANAVVDLGPEALVARVPEAKALCEALGLAEEMVAPMLSKTFMWTRGRLRELPDGLVFGVPTSPWAVARSGILSPPGVVRAGLDMLLPRSAFPPDPTVAEVISPRFGREAVDRLVEPLLGGIHAGRADRLSMASVAPHLAAAARQHRSLMVGLRAARPPKGTKAPPILLSIPGGLERVVARLRDTLNGVDVRTGTPVSSISRLTDGRYGVSSDDDSPIVADAVILAAPAFATARLVREIAPEFSSLLATIAFATVATALLAYPMSALSRAIEGSGFLVPRVDGRLLTACTFCTNKWPHLRGHETLIVRCSAGRWGDERALRLTDDALVNQLHSELAQALGLQERPREWLVTRWEQAIPQYETGHQARIAEIEASLVDMPGMIIAGASYHGMGISACIQDGMRAAALAQSSLDGHERLVRDPIVPVSRRRSPGGTL